MSPSLLIFILTTSSILIGNNCDEETIIEANSTTTQTSNINATVIPDIIDDQGEKVLAESLVSSGRIIRPKTRCYTGDMEGACHTGEDCFRKGGQVTNALCTDINQIPPLYCCTFVHTCGDVSSEKVTYFRSPDYPNKSAGSLACDYDLIVQSNICAIRIEYLKVNLARKLGGVCDIDQLFILNSVDGPTTGQCGPLSGYSTTVAVGPSQTKPVKLALLVQNEGTYHWDIKVIQLACNQVKHFKRPRTCGEVKNEIIASEESQLTEHNWYLTGNNVWKKQNQLKEEVHHDQPQHVWWNYPEPIFNTFYYGSTKRHLEQHNTGSLNHQAKRRVVAGSDAFLGEFPWVVAIGLDEMFFCGGALICTTATDGVNYNILIN